jgi:DNA-binding MarR family transcriptional regulator
MGNNVKTSRKTILVAILFTLSAFTLVGKLLMPTPIQIIIQGEEPIVVGQILSYTQIDVIKMAVSALLLGISGFYLLFSDFIETRGSLASVEKIGILELDVKFALRLLDGDKRKVFGEVVEAGGEILQSELPIRTGFSKAKITRILDYLERKGLIIRKSHGMTNKVIINRNMRKRTSE